MATGEKKRTSYVTPLELEVLILADGECDHIFRKKKQHSSKGKRIANSCFPNMFCVTSRKCYKLKYYIIIINNKKTPYSKKMKRNAKNLL